MLLVVMIDAYKLSNVFCGDPTIDRIAAAPPFASTNETPV